MSTNLAKLKKAKGAPPAAASVPDVIAENPRKEATELRPIQVRVPIQVFEEFSEQAGREFGFTHGAKKQLFLRMWKAYKKQNM
ncbi:hypothetical protein JANAI62_37500 [Jannaschia pagri]|uniref:BrnA antitoxin of type II toxin-antitoxin system n=1 Tax=Jannaschia pagri TaxID=2829797 RepID=A0ABQ4NRW2_9RHOB|nr:MULTISPECIES: hypothetical protein [unclassified Jannaschia]GIT93343.1 hypothetical protein JANAI61_38010 [Jannaschia sp. AI_61]GIT97127.1 hypothetical protein JANAI62_37500 [Jannaschia sp. AI_62]